MKTTLVTNKLALAFQEEINSILSNIEKENKVLVDIKLSVVMNEGTKHYTALIIYK
jgi:uncharacterized protein YycO